MDDCFKGAGKLSYRLDLDHFRITLGAEYYSVELEEDEARGLVQPKIAIFPTAADIIEVPENGIIDPANFRIVNEGAIIIGVYEEEVGPDFTDAPYEFTIKAKPRF